MNDDAFLTALVSAHMPCGIYEIECPRCMHRCHLVQDCVYCGGNWMIPLNKIAVRWMEAELVAAARGDRPEWMVNGIYHLYDTATQDIDRWLVCEHGVFWISEERYLVAKMQHEEAMVKLIAAAKKDKSGFVGFFKKVFRGEQ